MALVLLFFVLWYFYKWVLKKSEWLLFNANSEIFQQYHGENKLIFKWDDDEALFVLDQHA